MKLKCLFCSSFHDIPLDIGRVYHCPCSSYGCLCYRSDLDELKKNAAGFLGLNSPAEVIYDYAVIFFSKDPLILLWIKKGSRQPEGAKG